MGLFSKKPKSTAVNVTVLDGSSQLEVVGESQYQEAIWQQAGVPRGNEVRVEALAILVPEPSNEHDRNAVAVWLPTGKVGYLNRTDAATYLPAIRALMAKHGTSIGLDCVIVGGGYHDGHAKSLGVWLHHDPVDFGLAPARASVRTGESQSGASSWQDKMPDDSVKRITYLRKVLTTMTDPFDRHYVYLELEETLYKARTVFPTALADYEAVATVHDGEMDTIAPALLARFDGMPMLPTYKQMTIMKVKAKDDEAALRWARRGMELYGDRCTSADGADDLAGRVTKLEAKLGIAPTTPSPTAVPPPPPSVPAKWYPDPMVRFELRYHDGTAWTETVSRGGVVAQDPLA